MLEDHYWADGICDICSWSLHKKALEFVEEGVMDERGNWIGPITIEKSAKWGEALKIASEKLTTHCLYVMTTDDRGCVCKECLTKWLKEETHD